MTLHDFLGMWLETYIAPKRAAKTVQAYRYALAHLSPGILAEDLRQLSPIALQREINQLSAVYSRQAQLMFQALRSALKRAYRLELIDRNPMDRVDPPTHQAKEAKTLTAAEAAAYLRECGKQPAGPLLALMLCLGLRRNEARGLRCADLDGEGVLHVRNQRGKGGVLPLKTAASRRDLPVPGPLRAHFRGDGGAWVVDVSESELRRQHLRVLAAIGVEGITLHGLRHTAATLAAAEGIPLATLQHFLGHRHFTTTADFYIHANLSALYRCTSGLYNVLDPGDGARLEIV